MRNIKFLLCIALCVFTYNTFAQSVQCGQVLLYQGKEAKTPLARVALSAVDAPAVQSDEEGRFNLKFRTLHAGDLIRFRRISLAGYEVMNKEAVEAFRIANTVGADNKQGDQPCTIVMCKSDELNQLRDNYREVAASNYQKKLEAAQKQIRQLQTEGKMQEAECNKRLDELEMKYEAQMQNLDTYVDKFARIDLSELDDREAAIIALVQEGKIDEAIAKYDELNLTQQLQEGVQAQRQLTEDAQRVDAAIDVKQQEGARLEQNLKKQEELLQKVQQQRQERE